MKELERQRLDRYIADAEKWLFVITYGLRCPENSQQAAAGALARAVVELLTVVNHQMNIDGGQ
jgi:hypothetical protein